MTKWQIKSLQEIATFGARPTSLVNGASGSITFDCAIRSSTTKRRHDESLPPHKPRPSPSHVQTPGCSCVCRAASDRASVHMNALTTFSRLMHHASRCVHVCNNRKRHDAGPTARTEPLDPHTWTQHPVSGTSRGFVFVMEGVTVA